ncbi:MAG: phosphoribosylaminoimidazolesuccinocarboxamide synthase [Candidatus Aenigmatarchaeota archaeon]
MGSVKDLMILKPTQADQPGIARFIFSNRYSVFDWGEMPDHLENKGSAIALLSAYFFELLEKRGIPNHYLGMVEEGKVKRLKDLKNPSNVMEIKLLRVLKPEFKGDHYDYSIYQRERGNYLIPLEVIYRNSLPPGSSVFKRLESGQITLKDLGLEHPLESNQKLKKPIYDVSTKLETTDRYLSWKEAQTISGLNEKEIVQLKRMAEDVNHLITSEFSKLDLVNEDGKIEAGLDQERQLILADVVGTLDECRFSYETLPVSKELIRIYYRNTRWFQAVEQAKKKDLQNWKSQCELKPNPLPTNLKILIEQIYCACTNEITQREWFKNVPPLKSLLKEAKEIYLLLNKTVES